MSDRTLPNSISPRRYWRRAARRDAFDDMPLDDQMATVKFLKTLQVLPDHDCGVEAAPLVPPAPRRR